MVCKTNPVSSHTRGKSRAVDVYRLVIIVHASTVILMLDNGGLRELLEAIVEPERLVLTDLCRASFVEQRLDGFSGGDEVVRRHSTVYDQWVDAGSDWTL